MDSFTWIRGPHISEGATRQIAPDPPLWFWVGPTRILPTIFSPSRVTRVSVCHSVLSLSSTGLASHPAATPLPSPVPSPDRPGSSSPAVRYARILTSLLLPLILRGLPRPHRTAANRAARFGL
jgi:hypothetical protein